MKIDKAFAGYLLSLEDESFFAVHRNYLGPIQTPYNKHDLIQALQDFLIRPATGAAIRTLITPGDLVLLSAVTVLGAPEEEQLLRFLAGEHDYESFQTAILNCKDRLLLIDGANPQSVRINPVLTPALEPLGLGIRYLVRGEPLSPAPAGEAPTYPWLSPGFAAAAYAFLKDHTDPFTRTGTLRKRTSGDLADRFGTLIDEHDPARFLRFILMVTETLGLVTRNEDDSKVTLRPESWEHFSTLPERWIRALLWAGALTSTVERAFEYAELLFHAVETVPGERSFSNGELIRLLQLSGIGLTLPIDRDTVERMAGIGVLIQVEEGDTPRYALNPTVPEFLESAATEGAIRVQANMEIGVPPGAPFTEAFTVARLSNLHRYDTVATFTLTEESVAAARRDGLAEPLAELHSVASELPQNVRFLLKRWETRSRAVRLLHGLVLTADEEEAAILRDTPDFIALLQEELAPGIFLLRSEESQEVEKLLNRMDIGSAPTVEHSYSVDLEVPEYERYLFRYQQPALRAAPTVHFPAEDTDETSGDAPPVSGSFKSSSAEDARALRKELAVRLEECDLPEDARQELALRVERGLILFPEQIRAEVVPQYGIEVRGLDYLGKIRMIEHAIGNGDMLEVITRSGTGKPNRVLVRPREIVESGADLMLRAIQEPGDKAIKIRIRRISLLRRLSGTLISRSRKSR